MPKLEKTISEEQVKIGKNRAQSDTELIRDEDAEIVFDEKTGEQKLRLTDDKIDSIHSDMEWEKKKRKGEEKEKDALDKIESLELKKGQVVKIVYKNSEGEQVHGLYYFPGSVTKIGREHRQLMLLHSKVDHHEFGDHIYLNSIDDISIGDAKDIAYAEKEKKEFGPFKDGSRIIEYHNTTREDFSDEPWDFFRLIDSKGRIVLKKDKKRRDDDFDKLVSDLRSGLTLEECWHEPQKEKEKIGRDKERIKKMKKIDPGMSEG